MLLRTQKDMHLDAPSELLNPNKLESNVTDDIHPKHDLDNYIESLWRIIVCHSVDFCLPVFVANTAITPFIVKWDVSAVFAFKPKIFRKVRTNFLYAESFIICLFNMGVHF